MNYLLVFLGGGIGSVIRFMIGILLQNANFKLPIATLLSNFIACVIFALGLNFAMNRSDEQSIRLLLLTGFCGGLSTFSTFGYETFLLIKQQQYGWMAVNILISTTLCLCAFLLIKNNGPQ